MGSLFWVCFTTQDILMVCCQSNAKVLNIVSFNHLTQSLCTREESVFGKALLVNWRVLFEKCGHQWNRSNTIVTWFIIFKLTGNGFPHICKKLLAVLYVQIGINFTIWTVLKEVDFSLTCLKGGRPPFQILQPTVCCVMNEKIEQYFMIDETDSHRCSFSYRS